MGQPRDMGLLGSSQISSRPLGLGVKSEVIKNKGANQRYIWISGAFSNTGEFAKDVSKVKQVKTAILKS